jgi:hypothetical protein
MASTVVSIASGGWAGSALQETGQAGTILERGDVLLFPDLAFPIEPADQLLFSPQILS